MMIQGRMESVRMESRIQTWWRGREGLRRLRQLGWQGSGGDAQGTAAAAHGSQPPAHRAKHAAHAWLEQRHAAAAAAEHGQPLPRLGDARGGREVDAPGQMGVTLYSKLSSAPSLENALEPLQGRKGPQNAQSFSDR